jgi:hypothetical protein
MNKEKMKVRSMRLTDSQYGKYLSLGGNAWLRMQIAYAKRNAQTERLRKMRESGIQQGEVHELAR